MGHPLKSLMVKHIIILIPLAGCTLLDEPHQEITPDLIPFVNEFYTQAHERGVDCRYSDFILTIEPIQAKCNCPGITTYSEIPTVKIDTDAFNHYTQAGQTEEYEKYYNRILEAIIFHELGHAILGKGHSTGLMSADKVPYHSYAKYEDKRKEYLDELFKSF